MQSLHNQLHSFTALYLVPVKNRKRARVREKTDKTGIRRLGSLDEMNYIEIIGLIKGIMPYITTRLVPPSIGVKRR